MKWVYEFSVWPSEERFTKPVFDLFWHLTTRIAMEFTEEEFGLFRSNVEPQGIILHEISRVPFHEQETVL